tara:strand:+ start:347 stop:595 length:249 start_codon:yes stop_codon:yes gene_type:complete
MTSETKNRIQQVFDLVHNREWRSGFLQSLCFENKISNKEYDKLIQVFGKKTPWARGRKNKCDIGLVLGSEGESSSAIHVFRR